MKKIITIAELLQSNTADNTHKGDMVFDKIKELSNISDCDKILLDFNGIELVYLEFLNAITQKVYDKKYFDLGECSIQILHMNPLAEDLVRESILIAKK